MAHNPVFLGAGQTWNKKIVPAPKGLTIKVEDETTDEKHKETMRKYSLA